MAIALKMSRDDRQMFGFMAVIAIYLMVALAFPLYAVLAKSFSNVHGDFIGLTHYITYFTTPYFIDSVKNSIAIALLTTFFSVTFAFLFAYALTRSCMPGKSWFKVIALVPILVPSLLPGIALIYLFGRQGLMKWMMFGHDIYGPIGIVMAEVFFTLPHAFLIMMTALSLADVRLVEAATALKASRSRIFFSITLPSIRYGLMSAAFIVFTLTITDFGAPKVIGGDFNVLATDIYKQVIGQQNFALGAVVSLMLLLPAVLTFCVDRIVQSKQIALLSTSIIALQPKPNKHFDRAMLASTLILSLFILSILGVCQFAALVQFYPYDLSLSLVNYQFNQMMDGGWVAYFNSLELAVWTTIIGTPMIFIGAFLIEKSNRFSLLRSVLHGFSMLPMAVPGLVLGLAYIFFFNAPYNPLNFLYHSMGILVISTITHFYTVPHLTATTALKQMDTEFESISISLKTPFYKTFTKITVPICLPAIIHMSIYLFVNAMTTVSAVVFLYGAQTALASVAILNMDDAGDIAPAAAMGMMIFYTNICVCVLYGWLVKKLLHKTQAWRSH